MMKSTLNTLLFFCFVLFLSQGRLALSEDRFYMNLAEDHVDITTGFTGGNIIAYGQKPDKSEVFLILEGPRQNVIVRRKDNILGAWVNRSSMKFENVPLYYDYAVSSDEQGLELLEIHGLGPKAIEFKVKGKHKDNQERVKVYKDAFMRELNAQGLYSFEPAPLKTISDSFFKVRFSVPANVPKGEYVVRAYWLDPSNTKIIGEHIEMVTVGQAGVSSRIHKFARKESLLYAILCVLIAFISGWLSNKITRRS